MDEMSKRGTHNLCYYINFVFSPRGTKYFLQKILPFNNTKMYGTVFSVPRRQTELISQTVETYDKGLVSGRGLILSGVERLSQINFFVFCFV